MCKKYAVSELLRQNITDLFACLCVCEGFHNVWIYTGLVFTLTMTRINQGSAGALGICLFSKNNVNKANQILIIDSIWAESTHIK